MKKKNTLKQIITTILVAALLITGISLDGTVTATAATTATDVQNYGTVTMKPGDTKKVIVKSNKSGENMTISENYRWTSSNTDVVKVSTDFVSQSDFTECLELVAISSGTATLTGTPRNVGYSKAQITVTVKQATPTAKQKKCKHSWKTTKKATCERTGIKTCKKCKLQKSIKKTAHKYVNTTVKTTKFDGYEYIVQCSGCYCELGKCTATEYTACDNECTFTVVVTTREREGIIDWPYGYDKVIYVEDFGGVKDDISTWSSAITEACDIVTYVHGLEYMQYDENGYPIGSTHGSYADIEHKYGERQVTKKVKACTYCGKEK